MLSRTLACIADIIGVKANNKGGLRSGPAANLSWQEGLELLKVCILFFSRKACLTLVVGAVVPRYIYI